MIEISYSKGERVVLQVRGHAGAAGEGFDPVCAGVSALVLTLAENLSQLAARGELSKPQIRLEHGFARIVCPHLPAVTPVFDTILAGLALLGRLYPQYIKEVNYG